VQKVLNPLGTNQHGALPCCDFGDKALAGAIPDRALRLLKQSRGRELTVASMALRRAAYLIHALTGAENWRGVADTAWGERRTPQELRSEEFGARGSRDQPSGTQTHTCGNPHLFNPAWGSAEGASDLRSAGNHAPPRPQPGGGQGALKNSGIPRRGRPASFCGPKGRYEPTTAARCENFQEQTRQGDQNKTRRKITTGRRLPRRHPQAFQSALPAARLGPGRRRTVGPQDFRLRGFCAPPPTSVW
jgi:hypothetical protein